MGRELERQTVRAMVRLYCRRHHGGGPTCQACAGLLAYAEARLARCRYGDGKPQCRNCPVHCYAPGQRERIVAVMRWAGPRMFLRHPVLALRHLLNRRRPGPPAGAQG